jgi:hypothetical protein
VQLVKKEKMERSPFQRKRQGKVNCCPFDREPHANKAIQIGAYQPGKGKGDTKSAQENKEITEINSLANPSGSFDPEGSLS